MRGYLWISLLIPLLLSACSPNPQAPQTGGLISPLSENVEQVQNTPRMSSLPDLGQAPELENTIWLNVDAPLRLSDLRGKVVLLEMWTLGCINCQHVIPSLRELHDTYADQGLVIIGNHYPEFSYEKDLDTLKDAIQRFDIAYAVAQDNDGQTWRAYNNRYWPTLYLIDRQGHIRYVHIGEGAYQETEKAIQDLLAEPS